MKVAARLRAAARALLNAHRERALALVAARPPINFGLCHTARLLNLGTSVSNQIVAVAPPTFGDNQSISEFLETPRPRLGLVTNVGLVQFRDEPRSNEQTVLKDHTLQKTASNHRDCPRVFYAWVHLHNDSHLLTASLQASR